MPVNLNMLQQAIATLQQQGQGQFAGAIPQAEAPVEPVYGVSKPAKQPEPSDAFATAPTNAYYGTMAAKAQDPFFGGGHLAALKSASGDAQQSYKEQLARASEATSRANAEGGRTEIAGKVIDKAPDLMEKGAFGVIEPLLGNMTDDTF